MPNKTEKKPKEKKVEFIIDATNVCSWHKVNINQQRRDAEYSTSLNVVLKLANILTEQKKHFKCIFDASTPYKLPDDEKDIYTQLLKVLEREFYQVTGGQRADDWVLALADKYEAKIISTDRFRDFQNRYKWLEKDEDKYLVKGGIMALLDDVTLVIPSLRITETIDKGSRDLFIDLARKKGLEDKLNIITEGRVKSYNPVNQYGFLYADNGEEVYFKNTEVQLQAETPVHFRLFREEDKIYARNVVPQLGVKASKPKNTKKVSKKETAAPQQASVVTQMTLKHGLIQWFNGEKNYGVIKETETDTSFMFKADVFEHPDVEPQKEMSVSFITEQKGSKEYAVQVRLREVNGLVQAKSLDTISQTETVPKSASLEETEQRFEKFRERAINLINDLNKKELLIGAVQSIKPNYGFIKIDGSIESAFFKPDEWGLENLKVGRKLKFNIEANDRGFLACNVEYVNAPEAKTTPVEAETEAFEAIVVEEESPKKASQESKKEVAQSPVLPIAKDEKMAAEIAEEIPPVVEDAKPETTKEDEVVETIVYKTRKPIVITRKQKEAAKAAAAKEVTEENEEAKDTDVSAEEKVEVEKTEKPKRKPLVVVTRKEKAASQTEETDTTKEEEKVEEKAAPKVAPKKAPARTTARKATPKPAVKKRVLEMLPGEKLSQVEAAPAKETPKVEVEKPAVKAKPVAPKAKVEEAPVLEAEKTEEEAKPLAKKASTTRKAAASTRKPAAKKATVAKTTAAATTKAKATTTRKPAAKKAASTTTAAKKTATTKTTTAAKKPAAKKATTTTRKAAASTRKPAAAKTAATKTTAAAKKTTTTRKTAAKKPAAKTTTAKKTASKDASKDE